MRLSAIASRPEQVRIYPLAPHRLALRSDTPGMTVTRAARCRAGQMADPAAAIRVTELYGI
jgi:hypothetical protein